MGSARDEVLVAEKRAALLPGKAERFSGWGLMGLPFRSGDVLATRRFPASSVGAGYTSVWHRDPNGRWTIYADAPPETAGARLFGSAAARGAEKIRMATDEAVERSAEMGEVVRQMEQEYSSLADSVAGRHLGPQKESASLPSAEELIRDIERFLKQDGHAP